MTVHVLHVGHHGCIFLHALFFPLHIHTSLAGAPDCVPQLEELQIGMAVSLSSTRHCCSILLFLG